MGTLNVLSFFVHTELTARAGCSYNVTFISKSRPLAFKARSKIQSLELHSRPQTHNFLINEIPKTADFKKMLKKKESSNVFSGFSGL